MYCPKCGKFLPDKLQACEHCGHNQEKSRISNKAILLAAIAAIVSVGSVLLSFLPRDNPINAQESIAEASPSPTITPTPRSSPASSPTQKPKQISEPESESEPEPTPRPQRPRPEPTPEAEQMSRTQAYAITRGPFTLNARSYAFYPIPPRLGTSLRIEGWFEATGGSRNDIEVYILDEMGFANFRNGNSAQTYYNSGRATAGRPHALLPLNTQNYYVVFNNRFSFLSPKAVKTYMTAWYYDLPRH